ncbi:MAG TPA: DUF308 domain-containing protein [Actinoplanes sp.]|nr:DUF308 domain-containing protein [Actinoplanes sp.]
MAAGGSRRGRRDNGLDAADYAVAGDVDPRIGEHLLDVLAAGGIAAYLQPSADLNHILRTTTLPARPTDRLYVDKEHLSTARDHLQRLTEGAGPTDPAPQPDATPASSSGQSDLDAQWAQIVAGFDTPVEPGSAPWPAAEDRGTDRPDGGPAGAERPGGLPSAVDFSGISLNRRRTDEPSLLDGLDTFGDDLDDGEGYTPPPPPPLPPVSKFTVAGVFAVVIGFVLFLRPALLPGIDPDVVTLLGFTAVVAGAITLVWRLRTGDDDDDFDDGAVV